MHSIVARATLRRAALAPVSRTAASVSKRYSSTMHDNDPEVLEREKQRNLDKSQHKTSTPIQNAPMWNQYLASASEANIKADRSDHTPEEMASETVKHIKARHHMTPNHEDRLDALEAGYERDETMGPLSTSETTGEEDIEEVEITKRVFHKNSGTTSGAQ